MNTHKVLHPKDGRDRLSQEKKEEDLITTLRFAQIYQYRAK